MLCASHKEPYQTCELLDLLSVVPVQSALRADPDVAIYILEYARYAVIGKTICYGNMLESEMIAPSGRKRLRQAP